MPNKPNPDFENLKKELENLKAEYQAIPEEIKENIQKPMVLMGIPQKVLDLGAREHKAVDQIKEKFPDKESQERIKLKALYLEVDKAAQEAEAEIRSISVF